MLASISTKDKRGQSSVSSPVLIDHRPQFSSYRSTTLVPHCDGGARFLPQGCSAPSLSASEHKPVHHVVLFQMFRRLGVGLSSLSRCWRPTTSPSVYHSPSSDYLF